MRYVFDRMHWVVIALATVALIFIALESFSATSSLAESQKWVGHTHEVETVIMSIRSSLYAAQSALVTDSLMGEQSPETYSQAQATLSTGVADLRKLTVDNPSQQTRLDALDVLIKNRTESLRQSGSLAAGAEDTAAKQREFVISGRVLTGKALSILDDMRDAEEALREQRIAASRRTFTRMRVTLAAAYAIVVLVMFVYFRGLVRELQNRRRAEESVRQLSGRILQLQDAERRKIARELHDSFGQIFAALKMNLDQVAIEATAAGKPDKLLSESLVLLERCIEEARTLSHLLHPPLLDELGFVSAAKTFIEGFSERSRLQVNVDFPEDLERLPDEVELTLFRALQESLTNIHRHSGSNSVDISLERSSISVVLIVRDYGKGISPEFVERFANRTGGTGVGLAGLRERVRELKGHVHIRLAHPGTALRVSLPVPNRSVPRPPDPGAKPAEPNSNQSAAVEKLRSNASA